MAYYIEDYSPSQPSRPTATYVTDNYEPTTPGHMNDQSFLSQRTAVRLTPTNGQQWLNSQYSVLDDYENNIDLNMTIESRFDTDIGDSQPVSNQQFYQISILLKRAKLSERCPNGSLRQRRTTSQGESHTRYAQDCYLLQQFITNNDPKPITELFTKRKMSFRPEQHTTISAPKSQQIETAELKSRINLLTQDVTELKQQQVKDNVIIDKLSHELAKMKCYTTNLLNTFNKQYAYHTHIINFLKTEVFALKNNVSLLESTPKTLEAPTNIDVSTQNNSSTYTAVPYIPIQSNNGTENNTNNSPLLFKSIGGQNDHSRNTDPNPTSNIISKSVKDSEKGETNTNSHININDTPPCNSNRNQKSYAEAVSNGASVTDKNVQGYSDIPVQVTSHRRDKQRKRNKLTIDHGERTEHTTFESALNPLTNSGNQHQQYDENEPVFESVNSRKTRRYYIGGIAHYSNRSGMIQFLKMNGITPVTVKLIVTHRGSLAAKITLYENDWNAVENKSFWPRKMYCRRWYSEAEWESLFYTTADIEKSRASNVD
ncbi:hypothetical protein ACF0H5_011398 [Mactra antiquata]